MPEDAPADAPAEPEAPQLRGRKARIDPSLDPTRVVEAALFSAGKPLDVVEIVENTGLTKRQVTKALKDLVKEYDARDTALEVGQAGDKWGMQVRTEYAPSAQRLAPMEIPVRTLKTLALVAYHQPLLQSELVDMVGPKCYDHVRELTERGLVRKRLHGQSFILTTSERFPEYFGIPATDREKIKRFLAERVGLKVQPKKKRKTQAFLPTEPEAAPPVADDAADAGTPEADDDGAPPAPPEDDAPAADGDDAGADGPSPEAASS